MLYNQLSHAGYFVRLAAGFVDLIIVTMLGVLAYRGISYFGGDMVLNTGVISIRFLILYFIANLYYYVVLPTTKIQGTIGKHLFSICITDKDGAQISLGRSIARYLAYFASAIPIAIGIFILKIQPVVLVPFFMQFIDSPRDVFGSLTFPVMYMFFATMFIPFGFLLIGLTKQKTALHDVIASTRVCYKYNL